MFPSPAQRTFSDNLTWRITAALPLLGFLAWAIYDYYESRSFDLVLWGFTAFFAALFIFACVWAAARRVSIHAEGVSYKSLGKEMDLVWSEITETRYGQTPVNTAAHFGLLGLLIAALMKADDKVLRTLELIGPRKITINSNIRDGREAMRRILETLMPRFRQEAERMLSSGVMVSFGGISLTPAGVVWKGKDPIPYGKIVKARIDGAHLGIKAEGKWLDNISLNTKKVPNVFVLLDMIEQRRAAAGQSSPQAVAVPSVSLYV